MREDMMDSKLYNVVFQGEIAEGYTLENVKRHLSSMFKLNTKQIEEIFAGKPLVVKDHVDYQTALKYKTAFEKAGTVCHLVPTERPGERGSETPQKKPTQSEQQLYNVIFHGELAKGQNIEQVKKQLCALFKTDMKRIDQLFTNKTVMIQGNVPYQTAVKFQKTFTRAGAICHIEPLQRKISKAAGERQEQAGKVSPQASKSEKLPDSRDSKQPRPDTHTTRKQQATVPKPSYEPAGSSEIASIVASYRAQIHHRDSIFIAPNIPEEMVDMAVRAYAYAYRKQHEQALLLMDIRASGERLLLSDKRLYLWAKNTRPRSFKLTNIQSLSFQGHEVSINEKIVFSVPSDVVDDMKRLVELIQKVATYIAETTPREQQKKVEEKPQEAPSTLAPLIKKAIVPVIVIVLIVIGFNYFRQSRQLKPESGTVTELITEESAQDESTTDDVSTTSSQSEEATGGIKDEGTRCKTHKYVLLAGSSEILTFSRKYPLEEQETIIYEEEQETIIYETDMDTNTLINYGIYIAPPVVRYETSTVGPQVWAFDGRQVFDAVRNDPSYDKSLEWGEGGGVPHNIAIEHKIEDKRGILIKIRWRDDGYAVLEALEGVTDKVKIGKLTKEELIAKLNPGSFQPMLKYRVEWLNKTFELLAMQIQDTQTVKIQIYDVSVTVPDSIEQKTDLGSVSFKPTEGWKERLSVNVKGSWGRGSDPNKMHVVITGPAETAGCFQ
jgi:hypothetical protein